MKGIGLENKDLGRFWNAVCPEATMISRAQFKLFCKYCAVFHKNMPFNQDSFACFLDPILFVKNPSIQATGQSAVDRLQSMKAAQDFNQSRVPQPIVQSNVYNQSAYGQARPYQAESIPAHPPGFNPQPAYQSQMPPLQSPVPTPTPQTQQPYAPTSAPASQADNIAGQFLVSGTNANRISPEDYVLVKKVVESIPAARSDEFTFDELKGIILAFKIANTKEATRIWKLVDAQGKRVISKEGKIRLRRHYLVVLSVGACSQRHGSPSLSSPSLRELHQD